MTNHLLNNGSALYDYLNTNGTIDFYYQKQSGATAPYGLVNFVTANDDYTFSENGFRADYEIKIVSDRTFPLEAVQQYGTTHELIQDAALTLPGVIRVRRESTFQYEDQQSYWHVGGIYNIETWEN
jgi:hypothetical protein